MEDKMTKTGFIVIMIVTVLAIGTVVFGAGDTSYRPDSVQKQIERLKVHSMQIATEALSMAYTAGYNHGLIDGASSCNEQESRRD